MMQGAEPFGIEAEISVRRAGRAGAVVMTRSLATLSEIHDRDSAMVIVTRALPHGLENWLAAWAPHAPHVDGWLDADADVSFVAAGLPPGELRDAFVVDLATLLRGFMRVAGVARCRLAAGPVRNDSCRKFHVDHIPLRLITTYAGPGTEWVPDHAVDFTALDHPESCDCASPPSLVRDPSAVRHATAGDVLLMKGELYSNDVRGQVHRSPPIQGTNITRYVVVLTAPGRSS